MSDISYFWLIELWLGSGDLPQAHVGFALLHCLPSFYLLLKTTKIVIEEEVLCGEIRFEDCSAGAVADFWVHSKTAGSGTFRFFPQRLTADNADAHKCPLIFIDGAFRSKPAVLPALRSSSVPTTPLSHNPGAPPASPAAPRPGVPCAAASGGLDTAPFRFPPPHGPGLFIEQLFPRCQL